MLLLAAIFATLLPGCDRKGETMERKTTWSHVTPEFDSNVVILEKAYLSPSSYERKKSLTLSLDSVASPQATAQRLYWRARLSRAADNHPRAAATVEEGLATIDSARFPYEWARLTSIKASLSTTPSRSAYGLAKENLAYFESIEDSMMIGATLMRLGTVMWLISDTIPAARYYLMADSVFSRSGLESYRLRNLLNIANTLDHPGEYARRDSLMRFLIDSPVARADSDLYHMVLRNSFLNTGNFDHMRRAYAYLGKDTIHDALRASYEGAMADYFIGNDFPADSVRKYARLAYDNIDKVSDPYARATIFNAMSFTAYTEGNHDAALTFYREFLEARLSLEQERFSLETTKADYRNNFERARHEEQLRHTREREIWITALVLACALAIAIWVVFYFRVERARVNRQRAEVMLQQNRNYLSACALAMDEKDRIIESLVKSVEKMHSDGKIAGTEARELTSNVRRSLNNSLERETFTELHKKLHPEFIRRLKKDYPILTESQLKHAAYIAMGLSSKQIAQIMNIEYESVKKSRTRLRSRMGLPPDSSLEDTLRGYAASV